MECRDVRPLIDAFLREPLLLETTAAIVAHLDHCPACRAEVDGIRRLRRATRRALTAAPSLAADPGFLATLGTRVRAEAERGAPAYRPHRRWLAIAAALVLVVGGGLGSRQWSVAGFTALLHAAAGDHQFCALTYKLAEKPITLEDAAVRYDIVNRALRSVEPPSAVINGSPIAIVERHSCVYDGKRFAHLVLRYRGDVVSLLIAPETDRTAVLWGVGPDTDGGVKSAAGGGGFHVAAFRGSQHVVFVVSTLDQHDVDDVAQAMAAPVAHALASAL